MTGGGIWSKKIQFYVGGRSGGAVEYFVGFSGEIRGDFRKPVIKYILKLWSGKRGKCPIEKH